MKARKRDSNRRQSPPIEPRKARAVAVSRHDDVVLGLLHFLLALLLPLFVLILTGCERAYMGEKIDYGPEVKPSDVNAALIAPLEKVDPRTIKLGEFVHFSNTQQINGEQPRVLVDTSRTVTSRQESADEVQLNVIQHQVTYENDGTYSKVSREFPVAILKDPEAEPPPIPTPDPTPLPSPSPIPVPTSTPTSSASPPPSSSATPPPSSSATPSPKDTPEPEPEAGPVVRRTYHRLKTSFLQVRPPPAVQQRPNCGGVPNCLLDIYRVQFDIVEWVGEKSARAAVDVAIAPDLPILATPFFDVYYSQCVSQTVPYQNGNDTVDVLVKQCTKIEDFRFESDSEPSGLKPN